MDAGCYVQQAEYSSGKRFTVAEGGDSGIAVAGQSPLSRALPSPPIARIGGIEQRVVAWFLRLRPCSTRLSSHFDAYFVFC